MEKLKTTLCWLCSSEYDIILPECPVCHVCNANVDLDKAIAQQDGVKQYKDEFARRNHEKS